MIKSQESRDSDVARKLHEQENCFGLTENAVIPKHFQNKENYKPRTLIDQTLELIDPTPNIYTLFMQFNERFFWNVLLPVEVKWSSRMTSCSGICSFHPGNGQCIISLSAPLLKLRPRKDLVETLLHEMIHAYLFLTNNNRDRDGHGPEFCKHMDRINKAAGTKITIYHNFHDEVKLYQQHWWKCNGPCQNMAPYFGTVRRAMNRAPGPTDFWWNGHQQTCGGQFIKIKEPENFKARGSANKNKVNSTLKNNGSANNMANWLSKSTSNTVKSVTASTPKNIKPRSNIQNSQNGLKTLGNSTNNVYGWGVGGPSSSNYLLKSSKPSYTPKTIKPHKNVASPLNIFKKLGNNTNNVYGWGTNGPNGSSSSNNSSKTTSVSTSKFFGSGTLGGSNTGRSNLFDKFDNSYKQCNSNIKSTNNHSSKEIQLIECSLCNNFVLNNEVNSHVNSCLITTDKKRKVGIDTFPNKQPKLNNLETANCPVCNKNVGLDVINEHLDECLSNNNIKDKIKNDSIISVSSESSDDLSPSYNVTPKATDSIVKSQITAEIDSFKCLVCNMVIPRGTCLIEHLEDCLKCIFNDDFIDATVCEIEEMSNTVSEISFDQTDKYPCPVCMELISESFMNQHLDTCLKST